LATSSQWWISSPARRRGNPTSTADLDELIPAGKRFGVICADPPWTSRGLCTSEIGDETNDERRRKD
jgi:hypothetical protein